MFLDSGGGGTGRENTFLLCRLVYETVLWSKVKRKGLKSLMRSSEPFKELCSNTLRQTLTYSAVKKTLTVYK